MIDQNKIHNRCLSNNPEERINSVVQLGYYFLLFPDRGQAWSDLHKLTTDKDSSVRRASVFALRSTFSNLPDKQQALDDLIKLTNDKGSLVSSEAAFALGPVFSHVLDKQQAWNILHRLIISENSKVRKRAAEALGFAFSHISDKQQAWDDLHKLTNDEYSNVRIYANHSLGKASIFKASQAEKEEDYKKELENAIAFFEKATQESLDEWSNPAQFCLPFYRSFHTILFEKQKVKREMEVYMAEAKNAVKGSENKELLFEAVNSLANALKEVQKLENMDLEAKKSELDFYRKFCDRAVELMRNTEESAPFAIMTMRKGLPILDRNLKELLEEIQDKAKNACKDSKGTDVEEIAYSVCREVQKWEIGSQEEMSWHVPNIVLVLKSKILHAPENKEILDMIESMKYEKDLSKQYRTLSTVIGLIPTVNVVPEKPVKEGFEDLQKSINKIDAKLDEMMVSLNSGPKGELVISKGLNIAGSGAQFVVTIPLAEIDYPELPMDLEKIKGKFLKVSELPGKMLDKVRGYLH